MDLAVKKVRLINWITEQDILAQSHFLERQVGGRKDSEKTYSNCGKK